MCISVNLCVDLPVDLRVNGCANGCANGDGNGDGNGNKCNSRCGVRPLEFEKAGLIARFTGGVLGISKGEPVIRGGGEFTRGGIGDGVAELWSKFAPCGLILPCKLTKLSLRS